MLAPVRWWSACCLGCLFGDRYKSVLVGRDVAEYFSTLLDHVHLNPVRARLVASRRGESLLDSRGARQRSRKVRIAIMELGGNISEAWTWEEKSGSRR